MGEMVARDAGVVVLGDCAGQLDVRRCRVGEPVPWSPPDARVMSDLGFDPVDPGEPPEIVYMTRTVLPEWLGPVVLVAFVAGCVVMALTVVLV